MSDNFARPDCVIVTGVSRGIGAAIAAQRFADGIPVIGFARGSHPPFETGEAAGRYEGHRLDLADPVAVDAASARLVERLASRPEWRRIDLINNAGTVDPIGSLAGLDVAAADTALRVNVLAPMIFTSRLLAAMRGRDGELRIMNVSSGAARRPIPGWSVYCTSKAALDMMSLCTQAEADHAGIRLRVTAIAPGIIDTAMQAKIRAADDSVGAIVGDLRAAHDEGRLQTAATTARDLLAYMDSDTFGSVPISDIRKR